MAAVPVVEPVLEPVLELVLEPVLELVPVPVLGPVHSLEAAQLVALPL